MNPEAVKCVFDKFCNVKQTFNYCLSSTLFAKSVTGVSPILWFHQT